MEVETCPQCGAPAKAKTRRCEYCKSEFVVSSISYLRRFDKAGINRYVSSYKRAIKDEPDNGELNFALGICYLELGLYDLALKFFHKAIELVPDEPEFYYYCALAMTKGKRPGALTLAEVRKMEEYLRAATSLDESRSKYYYLWMLIKYDYYQRNGLRVDPPQVPELLQQAANGIYEEEEITKMLSMVPVKDPFVLEAIAGERH